MTMNYKTLAKICVAISGSSIVYMFLITYEGTYFGWTVFFVFLAFAILFHALNEQEEEIAMLHWQHSPEGKREKEERQKVRWKKLAETDPRSNDPFYISDKSKDFKKGIVEGLREKDVREQGSSQNQKANESEIQVIFHRKNPSNHKNNVKN